MNESEKMPDIFDDPLETILLELQRIAGKVERETFFEKYGIVLFPVIISVIIGLVTFYTSYNILEYKVTNLMETHSKQNAYHTEMLKELKCDIGELTAQSHADEVRFIHINRRLTILERKRERY